MYLCTQNYDLKRGGTFETAKAGTFHSVTAGTLIPLFTEYSSSTSEVSPHLNDRGLFLCPWYETERWSKVTWYQ